MPLPYPMPPVSPFDTITAQENNERIANIEALAVGTGLNNGAITAVKTAFGGNYSTSEVNTGFTWVNGADIYKKTVFTGTLPNNTTKFVPHAVTGLVSVINIECIVFENSTTFFNLPLVSSLSGNAIAGVAVVGANIRIGSNANIPTISSHTTIYYTKA